MKNDEINEYIAVEIMGLCPHTNRTTYVDPGPTFTVRCKDCHRLATFPDYCSDTSPRSLLNEVVAKVDNDAEVTTALGFNIGRAVYEIRATAEQIARACVEAYRTTHVS